MFGVLCAHVQRGVSAVVAVFTIRRTSKSASVQAAPNFVFGRFAWRISSASALFAGSIFPASGRFACSIFLAFGRFAKIIVSAFGRFAGNIFSAFGRSQGPSFCHSAVRREHIFSLAILVTLVDPEANTPSIISRAAFVAPLPSICVDPGSSNFPPVIRAINADLSPLASHQSGWTGGRDVAVLVLALCGLDADPHTSISSAFPSAVLQRSTLPEHAAQAFCRRFLRARRVEGGFAALAAS